MVQCNNKDVPLPSTYGIQAASHMGNNEVTITPDHHAVRTNDGSLTGSIQGTADGRRVMGTTETPATVQGR